MSRHKLSLLCKERIKEEFREHILVEDCAGLAYQECSLASFGVPKELVERFSKEEVITAFEKAFAQNRVAEAFAFKVLTEAIIEKNLTDTLYGFMLLWFAKAYLEEDSQALRVAAVEAFL